MKKVLILESAYNVLFENSNGYSKWKRKNVTLRGIKSLGVDNGVWGSFGKGLYTVPLSNKSMAKEYGEVYFVVNAIPKNPKVVDGMNNAELWRQDLVDKFCKEHGVRYSVGFFEEHTSIEEEMLKLGYDGFIIKGREMVNYTPENIKYFRTERELERYYEDVSNISENKSDSKRIVRLEKWDGGFWWLIDNATDEPIDGDKRKYVVTDMAKRWNYKIVKVIDKTQL